jgi:hypothetical protein
MRKRRKIAIQFGGKKKSKLKKTETIKNEQ